MRAAETDSGNDERRRSDFVTVHEMVPVINATILRCGRRIHAIVGTEELEKDTSLFPAEICRRWHARHGRVRTQ